MRIRIVPLILLFGLISCLTVQADETEKSVSLVLPPESVANWYKPANKRQVWLHNMFSLRRDLQAVEQYVGVQDVESAKKWAADLRKHYYKIAEMVPEWETELDSELLENLESELEKKDYSKAKVQISRIKKNCNGCHVDYSAVTSLLYRTPDYSNIKVKNEDGSGEQSFKDVMKGLTKTVNTLKISLRENKPEQAMAATTQLRHNLNTLGQSCQQCHDDAYPRERILGAKTQEALDAMETALTAGDIRATGRNLGTAAVLTCARCHAVHRSVSDLKKLISH